MQNNADFIIKNAAFDWYQTTVFGYDGKPEHVLGAIASEYPDCDLVQRPALNGYVTCYAVQYSSDQPAVTVMWGGNEGVNVKFTGKHAVDAKDILQRLGFEHYPTRVDSAIDYTQQGFYDRAAKKLIKIAQKKGLKIEQKGDWVRGEGRTIYIGSPTSEMRLCMYEKGYERGLVGNPDFPMAQYWTRLELRVKPKKKASKLIVANCLPDQLYRFTLPSEYISEIFGKIQPKGRFGSVYTQSDNQRAIYFMVKQYKNALSSLAADLGSWESVGAEIGRIIQDAEA